MPNRHYLIALPLMAVLGCFASGTTRLLNVPQARFKECDRIACMTRELRKMGAEITVDGRVAVIEGGMPLSGAPVHACDLRAGAAMVTAGLCANGTTVVEDIHFIERGYERLVEKMNALGADIKRIEK